MSGVRVSEEESVLPEAVLGYHDRPLLFLGTWPGRGLFIFTLVDDDDEGDLWYAAPAPTVNVLALGRGQIAFRDVFTAAPTGSIAIVHDRFNSPPVVSWVSSSDLDVDSLPAEGFGLPSPLLESEGLIGTTDVRVIPRIIGSPEATRAPHPGVLAKMIDAFVSLVQVGSAKLWGLEIGRRGAIPSDLREAIPMRTLGIARASFGVLVEIGPETPQVLTGAQDGQIANPVEHVLQDLDRLLDAAANRSVVAEVFSDYGPRFAAQYRRLLESAVQAGGGFGVHWATRDIQSHSSQIPATIIGDALDAVRSVYSDQSVVVVDGRVRVSGFRQDRRIVWVFALDGALRDEVGDEEQQIKAQTPEGQRFEVPSEVNVRMQRTIEVDSATGDERDQWRLLEVLDPNNAMLGL